jgi:hypothetical protein
MKRISILWIIYMLWNTTIACGCLGTSTVKGGLKYSNFVFRGKVISSESVSLFPESLVGTFWEPTAIFYKKMKYTFEVLDIYKGKETSDTLIIYSGFGNGDCGYTFHIGNDYIVYATWNKSLKESDRSTPLKFLETDFCTRTQPFNMEESKEIESNLIAETNDRTFAMDINETLQTWVNYYKSFDKDFSLQNFIFERVGTINEMQGTICAIFDKCFDSRLAEFLIFSPNKKKYVDLDTYGMSLTKDNEADFEIDQAVNVVDIDKRTNTRIFFLGSVGRAEDTFWESDSSFVLLLNIDYLPRIGIIDLNTKLIKYYEYRSVLDFKSHYYYERLRKKGVVID